MMYSNDPTKSRTQRQLVLPERVHNPDGAPVRRALYVDCETTGFDWAHDEVIELALLPFTYTADGRIARVLHGDAQTHLRDPGRAIPEAITALTGLTDDDVRGKHIDVEAASALIRRSDLVIAHNARFDRPFFERVLPVTRDKPWACSAARDSVAGVGHQQRRAALSAVPLRRVRPRPPPCARRLRGGGVAPCASPAGHRADRAVGAPRTLRGGDGSALGGGLAVRGEGGAARSGVSMDAAGAQRHRPLVVDGSRARDGRRRACVAQRRGLRGVPPGVPHRPGLRRARASPSHCARALALRPRGVRLVRSGRRVRAVSGHRVNTGG